MIFTESKIKEWILRKLGLGTVAVELTDNHLDDAIVDAKEWWQSFVGQGKSVLLTLSGTTEYAEALIGTDVDYVTDVIFEVNSQDIANIYDWADVEFNLYTWFSAPNSMSSFLQYMQHRELLREVTGSNRDWEWDRTRRILAITPTPSAGEKARVVYISNDVELSYITGYEMTIFRNYALAQAMKTLAHIRMKYASKPGASGEFSMDGDSLYANAEALEQNAQDTAMKLSSPVGIFAG